MRNISILTYSPLYKVLCYILIITNGAGTAYPSGAPEFISGFRVTRSLVLCVCFLDRCLYFCAFSFDQFVVCPSSIHRFTDSDYLLGIFKLYLENYWPLIYKISENYNLFFLRISKACICNTDIHNAIYGMMIYE